MFSKQILHVIMLASASITTVAATAADQAASARGNPVPAEARVDQVLVITDATRVINVTGGSTVRFMVGGRAFSWNFQNGTASVVPFDLRQIAPDAALNHAVTVYVSDNPMYRGG